MKVMKKINNNIALCIDDHHRELIAVGTGIGFKQCPYEIENLDTIQRTFYDVDPMYYNLLNEISVEVLEVAARIVDIARLKIESELSPNVVFTLADHINFAIERIKKNIHIQTPLYNDIQHLYETEFNLGETAVKMIQQSMKVKLPKGEACNIAMHFVNAETISSISRQMPNSDEVIEEIIEMIGAYFQIHIDRNSFNYSRFVSHLLYLLKRQDKADSISSENRTMFVYVKDQYPKTYECVLNIKDYLMNEMNWTLNDEELLYLMLHINRLCARADCHR
ncbi:MAG TPA: transcription antiterminator LicT [Dielma fastidiosa]|uniref:PRD domain-containing protein n=2 Tax=Dielma fastidiosa TaxID=1034346 RepID=UPI000E52BFAF|nr:PRD domain-containing protein [Dielma fastidiosa]RHM98700.1 PRD domain-containing protein [Dielma fastidiosa]HAH93047.1 transcription antiterminator LicT [Dielma fastidiosa]